MKKNSILVKTVLMSMLTAGSVFSFTSCADDIEMDKAPEAPKTAMTRTIDDADNYYDINNDTSLTIIDETFNKDNWWRHRRIITRVDNNNATNNIVDKYNRTGYLSVELPWIDGSKVSNLPKDFCKGFTPENGWTLVANFCGRFGFVDANYIAFYNKYTGILRYFYYIPRNTDLNGATDHNWEILMDTSTAEHSVFGYALPNDRQLDETKMRTKLNAVNGGYYSQFTTPFGTTGGGIGKIQPKQGWYAFDVDLSVYRGNSSRPMYKDYSIKPIIRGYNESNVDLFGNVTANIEGTIDMKKCAANSNGGIFGPLEDVLGQVNDIKGFIGDAAKVYKDVMSGNVLDAIEGGISVAKKGCDIAGIDYGEEKSGFDGYQGTANLKLNGTINLSGKIKQNNVIEGPTCVEQYMKEFDFSDTHLGEGVWNLEKTPVVYFTNAQVQYRNEYTEWKEDGSHVVKVEYVKYGNFAKGPFGAQKEEWSYNDKKFAKTPSKPWCGYISYFDPSSVKVVLNPNLFTEDEIKNAKVYATCGVRKGPSVIAAI